MRHWARRSQQSWFSARRLFKKRNRWIALVAVSLSMLMPVRLSVLAPAEVIALNATAVTAPQDGVVGSFAVAPNARVKAGDLLFSLDDSPLLNRQQVALKSLEVAKADAHIAQQRAFDDNKSKAEVAVALGRVREKEAELASVNTQASRVEIRAERDGVVIFADANDWLGRPVQTGERVMQLAQPEDGGILVWLSVADAINLELDAPVRLFLHTEPLSPRVGQLIEASYQASLSPEGVASYRLRAAFDEGTELPRIGLRGTARISGDWVMLGLLPVPPSDGDGSGVDRVMTLSGTMSLPTRPPAPAPKPVPLPRIRDELILFPGSPNEDGTPAWVIQDPVSNRFYRIGWLDFELLVQWADHDAAALVESGQ